MPAALHARVSAHLEQALDVLEASGDLPAGLARSGVTVETPHDAAHGDLSTNAAMVMGRRAGVPPRQLAEALASRLAALEEVTSVEVAGPGFVNLRLTDHAWRNELATIAHSGERYGKSESGAGKTVNVEYVSANPTGPMHMGHCRGAVVGDALANLLAFTGHRVIREYYINDAGGQVDVLARSAHIRYLEALGESVGDIPEGLYPGDYLKPVGQALASDFGDRYRHAPPAAWLPIFRSHAVAAMMETIRADLALLGVRHDRFASEAKLLETGRPAAAEAWLRERDLIYDGVLDRPKGSEPEDWQPIELPLFRSTLFGDDQDRPIRKADGSWTYFGIDLAYHFEKARDADQMIDVWGADHAGTVKRIVAATHALTEGRKRFDVKLVQIVRLLRAGEPVKMSKRAGNFVTLSDVVREVGKDVVRFTMLTRKAEAPMDFDFAKVVEASKDNPVFYVHYAHARIHSLANRAAEAGLEQGATLDLTRLDDRDLALVKQAAQFPRIVEASGAAREPHRIAFFLAELAAAFHAMWNAGIDDPQRRFILKGDAPLSHARLALANAIGQVIRNGMALMGIEPMQQMPRAP
ncbi:arginine--tRNA ligase [Sphingomonas koreensis]|uniref:arginine--tRNA ligase n=1 Tax=Sphingomonas koreensis TaxID=93064 RepID=UPI00234F4CF2|nr:arginine--tRNA ligase [Sphingomonas koreensis]MDC7812261.1 arginine--tRNA ligase [Sphingomonas koreensis]